MELPHLGLMRLYKNEEVFFAKTAGHSLLDKIALSMLPTKLPMPLKAPGALRPPSRVSPSQQQRLAQGLTATPAPAKVTAGQQQSLVPVQSPSSPGQLVPAQAATPTTKSTPTAKPVAAGAAAPQTLLGSIGVKPWQLALGGLAAGGLYAAGKVTQLTGDAIKGVGNALGGAGGGHGGPQQWVSPGTPGLRSELNSYGY